MQYVLDLCNCEKYGLTKHYCMCHYNLIFRQSPWNITSTVSCQQAGHCSIRSFYSTMLSGIVPLPQPLQIGFVVSHCLFFRGWQHFPLHLDISSHTHTHTHTRPQSKHYYKVYCLDDSVVSKERVNFIKSGSVAFS